MALTREFISKQWNVLPVVRDDRSLHALQHVPDCLPIVSDITGDDVQSAIHKSLHGIGSVNVLINNAGIPGSGVHLAETSAGEVLSLIDVHCIGALRVCQAVVPYVADGGVVINISSRFGSISNVSKGAFDNVTCSYAYRIAKAAQNMLTQCMCREFIDKDIRICAVHPGRLKTESGLPGADRTAEEAAARIFAMLDTFEHGTFYSLFEETIEW